MILDIEHDRLIKTYLNLTHCDPADLYIPQP